MQRCEAGSRRLARKAVAEIVRDLEARGYAVAGCGLLLASGRPLPELKSILASHALIHAADGEHFRDALVLASQHRRLSILRIKERDLLAEAASRFRIAPDELAARVNAVGKPLGPPWTQDQKLAALLAWVTLASKR